MDYSKSSSRLYNVLMGNPGASNNAYNAIGRTAGAANNTDDNFFVKRGKSIENALGTTGAAIASKVYDDMENAKTENLLKDNKARMDDIAKKYGYNTYHDVWDARDKAVAEGDIATLELIDNTINPQLRAQANTNAQTADEKAAAYDDYRKNNYVSQKINQDPGKFAGSAMNTLSTAADAMALGAGIPTGALVNGAQGAWEGVADELEQNGLENFSAERAGQNALIGATTGAVTGAINKGISNKLAAKGGNLFKGGNMATRFINKINSETVPGRVLSTIGSGAARGAQSGLVAGAVGAGLSSAVNGVDVGQGIANTLQGAAQGARQGALSGGIMAGANLVANAALNKVAPEVGNAVRENQMRNAAYGDKLRDQFKGAWNSGDSAVAEKVIKPVVAKTASKFGEATGKIGTFAQNVAFQNAIRNPGKMKDPVYLGELTDEDVAGVLEAYKNAGVDLTQDPEALSAISVQNGKMYLNQENAQHIHDARVDGNGMSPRQVRKVFRNSTGDNAVVSDELTKYGNVTIGAPNDNGFDVSHLYVDEDGSIGVKTTYPAKSGTIPKQLKRASGGSQSPSANVSKNVDLPAGASALQGSGSIIQQDGTIVNSIDPWDRLAQESGYKDYNSAIKAFQAANPGVEVGENDAGMITTWLDQNQGSWTPNTVEETSVARNTTGLGEVPTSEQVKNKRLLVEEIQKQFYPVGKEVKRGTKPSETFYNLYEDWGLSDGDDIRVATSFANKGALIPQMVREVAGEAGVVDVNDAQAMVMNMKLNKQASSKVLNAIENIIDSTDTTIVGGKQGVDALQLQRALEQAASDARGTNYTYRIGNDIVDETTARNFERIARNIGDKLDNAVVANGAVQRVINNHADDIAAMKNAIPNNEKWVNTIDDKIIGAKNMSDLRSSMKDLVRAGIYIKAGDDSLNTVGSAIARNNADVPTTKAGVRNKAVNWVFDKINDSKTARNLRLANYDKEIRGGTSTNNGVANNAVASSSVAPPAELANATANYNPATQVYNAIGRTEGLTNAEQARTANYLADATQSMNATDGYMAPLAATTSSYGNTSAPTTTGTSLYNALNGGTGTTNQVATTSTNQTGYFQPTGDYWTDILAKAMASAIDANDVTAFASLYEMYQDAISKLQSSSDTTSGSKLTATQQRANAAMNSLERLSSMTPDTAYNLSNIPLIGNIATWGGNDYEAEAKSLAQQIGYMVSGSNIKDSEAENIGKSYVPQPWDNEQVRQNKLRRAYEIIQQYQNGYAEV